MSGEIAVMMDLLARLPGLGPRSARRVALHLLRHRDTAMRPLAAALDAAARAIVPCSICGNLDTSDPCPICTDPGRDIGVICVVEQVADLWALERARAFRGRYHVLGGTLSAIDGIGPDDLSVPQLVARAREPGVTEVILALNATVDGQTTAHYLAEKLEGAGPAVTRLAHGVPVGGELDYLDDGTLVAALRSRRGL
ncbi:MAG TPA: recombination mediator RecR [Inquilinus sp.]|nr:recombination mediator RecR [Inquilinus sp.]